MNYYKDGNRYIATIGTLNLEPIAQDQYETAMQETSKRQNVQGILYEKVRPLTADEVTALLIKQQINALSVDDNMALRMAEFYPGWEAGQDYSEGFKVQRGGALYKALQAHTSQTGWEPETAASLWEQINETHAGTMDDPIPYSGNMALTAGLYYMQDWVIYKCTRDTGNPVYHMLSELVGLYVEKA